MKRSWVAAVVAVLLASLVSALTACAARHEGSKGDGPKAHETTSPEDGNRSGGGNGGNGGY